jgi:hypothetical protein
MQGKETITVSTMLAVADTTARHAVAVAWQRKQQMIRAITVREIVRLLASFPSLVEIIDPSETHETVGDLIDALGAPGIIAWASLGADVSEKQLSKHPLEDVMHVFMSVLEITFPSVSTVALFPESKKAPKPHPKRPPPKADQAAEKAVAKDSNLVRMIKDATEYTLRTGRDGLDLSPAALGFAIRMQADLDRSTRIDMVNAIAAALGDKEAHKAVGDI